MTFGNANDDDDKLQKNFSLNFHTFSAFIFTFNSLNANNVTETAQRDAMSLFIRELIQCCGQCPDLN